MKKDAGGRAGCFEAWLHNHADAARRSLWRRLHAPGQTLIMVAVLGFILALPAYLWLLLENARALSAAVDHEPRITLYLDDTPEQELAVAAERIRQLSGIADVRSLSAGQTLVQYRASLPDPSLLDWLDENPLPAVIEVIPLDRTPAVVHNLEARLGALLPQALLISDHEWVRQLEALHRAGLRILLVISGLLALGVTLILAVASAAELRERREEISISRITGATDRFLRRPSLYGGLIIGFGGGLFSYVLLWSGVGLTRLPVEEAAAVLGLPLEFARPRATLALLLTGTGLFLGWVGARLGSEAALRD